jgi:hypothetical protein
MNQDISTNSRWAKELMEWHLIHIENTIYTTNPE